ncbi:M6 family metalloprotease domain-containing protein [Vibrio proteolyticus]|uniref:EF-hand domain-containing protein n=1 Tax=Vibrio proteolyticus NBRC 13287 TaxID=1219065 RepID=U3A065_VIBPR|nr:M6 family metalloprotease domain-containing protein [Vibrio proteolyticus]GAD66732.1 hypothetical protein VPR01S_05_00270 [Vibrio proteolyticus NBRC 13287]
MIKNNALSAGLLASLLVTPVFGTTLPAPVWHQMTFSDGSVKDLRLMGSEDMFWYQDRQGTLYIQEQDGLWYYGYYEQQQKRVVSTEVLASEAPPPQDANIHSHPIDPVYLSVPPTEMTPGKRRLTLTTGRQFAPAIEGQTAVTEQPLLVVQVSFQDEVMVNDFQASVFGINQQSVQDYFLKNSNGRYKVVPARETSGTENDGIVHVTLDINHPNCHSKTDNTCQTKLNTAFEKAYQALDADFDLSTYDDNGDGNIEPRELSVMFVFAGNDKASGTNKTPTIWPHKYSHRQVTLDGKTISAYCLFADFQHDHQSTMGVIAHELGHLMLGLPDLYSYRHNGSIGQWGLMGSGSWGSKPGDSYSGQTPVNMLAWSKEAAGFIQPKVLSQSGAQTVQTAQGESVIHLDPYLKQFGPRAYIENRRNIGYDRALPAEGLLVTSVSVDHMFNAEGPMQVQILQADNHGLLDNGHSTGDDGDVFPGSKQITELSDASLPSLMTVTAGRETNIALRGIVSDPNAARFSLDIPSAAGKSAWLTSFGRTYVSYRNGIDALGFAVDVGHTPKHLVGFQFYAKENTVALPMRYVLRVYPYNVNLGRAHFDLADGRELASGVAPVGGGQIRLPAPVALEPGMSMLVLEIENGTAEYSTQFLDAYLGDGQRKEQYFGGKDEYLAYGLSRGAYYNFPFAALFEEQIASDVVTMDDFVVMREDQSVTVDVKSNDQHLNANEVYRVEIGQPPSKGRFRGTIYTPSANINGVDHFTYRLVDSQGVASNYANVSVTISAVNDLPVFEVDYPLNSVKAGQLVTLAVKNIRDVDSDSHSYRWSVSQETPLSITHPQRSWIQVQIPSDANNGTVYPLTVVVADNQGGRVAKTIKLVVRNRAIAINDESVSVVYGEQILLRPAGEHDDSDIRSIEILTPPLHGEVIINGTTLVYTAPAERKETLYDVLKYKVIFVDDSVQTAEYELQVRTQSVAENQGESSGGSGGSNSPWVMMTLLWLFHRRYR